MHGADERRDTQGKRLHLTANLFAVAFGVAGLAQAWSAATQLAGASDWPGNVLWIIAAVTWLVTLAAYLGITSFVVLAPIIEQRLFVAPSLPPPLLPTIAIDLAPPVVAGNSWFAINGGKVDTPAAILAGLSLLMLLVQVRLIPLYRRATFGPGFWAFGFPFAAAVTYGVHWLAVEHVRGGTALGYTLVGILTAGFALLAAKTVNGLMHGTFLPRTG